MIVTDTTEAGLARYRALWDEAEHDAYRLRFSRSCECDPASIGPYDVTVRDGEATAVYFRGEDEIDDPERFGTVTVGDLFALVAGAFDQDAATIRIGYLPRLGVPVDIYIDYDIRIADEETSIRISGFETL